MTARCRSRAAEERLAGTNWYSECGVLSVGMPRWSAATRASFHTLAAPRPACSLPFGFPFADYRRMGPRGLADGISRDGISARKVLASPILQYLRFLAFAVLSCGFFHPRLLPARYLSYCFRMRLAVGARTISLDSVCLEACAAMMAEGR